MCDSGVFLGGDSEYSAASKAVARRQPKLLTPPQNKKNTPERVELMKYNANLRRYTLHREIK